MAPRALLFIRFSSAVSVTAARRQVTRSELSVCPHTSARQRPVRYSVVRDALEKRITVLIKKCVGFLLSSCTHPRRSDSRPRRLDERSPLQATSTRDLGSGDQHRITARAPNTASKNALNQAYRPIHQ